MSLSDHIQLQKTIPTDEFYSQLGNKELQRAERVYEKAAAKTPTSNKQDLKQSVLTMHKTSEVGSRRISDAGIRKNVLSQTGSHGMRQSQQKNRRKKTQTKDTQIYLDVISLPEGCKVTENRLHINHKLYQFKDIFVRQEQSLAESMSNSDLFKEVINRKVTETEFFLPESTRKCILISFNCIYDEMDCNFITLFQNYALLLLEYGKATWSMLAIKKNIRYDLLSMATEPVTLWRGNSTPLQKTLISKSKILHKLLQFASQRQKSIGRHQTILKVQFSNKNIIYIVLKPALEDKTVSDDAMSISNAEMIISEEIFHEQTQQCCHLSIISTHLANHQPVDRLLRVIERQHVPRLREKDIARQTEENLMHTIVKLHEELKEKRQELQAYRKNQQTTDEQELIIPSERAGFEMQRYITLKPAAFREHLCN